MERAVKWHPRPEVHVPCADISYTWTAPERRLSVLMHFSAVVGGLTDDLKLVFDNVLAATWEDESYGLIGSPAKLPKCASPDFSSYTHPTLIVQDSTWARKYADQKYPAHDAGRKRLVHYYLVSLNDLLHVLAESDPTASWVPASCA